MAISPVPIIAVILMLFSRRATVNGPIFLLGWVLALGVLSAVVYVLAYQSNPTTSSSANDTISWGKIVLGVLFLLLAVRQWRSRPKPGTKPGIPKWMAGVDTLTPGKAFVLGRRSTGGWWPASDCWVRAVCCAAASGSVRSGSRRPTDRLRVRIPPDCRCRSRLAR